MLLVQITFLSLKLAGYFMANAEGSNFYQAVHLVKGISLRHPLICWHGSFGAESTFPA